MKPCLMDQRVPTLDIRPDAPSGSLRICSVPVALLSSLVALKVLARKSRGDSCPTDWQ